MILAGIDRRFFVVSFYLLASAPKLVGTEYSFAPEYQKVQIYGRPNLVTDVFALLAREFTPSHKLWCTQNKFSPAYSSVFSNQWGPKPQCPGAEIHRFVVAENVHFVGVFFLGEGQDRCQV